jgi:hypothetical protein
LAATKNHFNADGPPPLGNDTPQSLEACPYPYLVVVVVVFVDEPLVPDDPLVPAPGLPGCDMVVVLLLVRVEFQGCQTNSATSPAMTTIATMANIAVALPPPLLTTTGSRMQISPVKE